MKTAMSNEAPNRGAQNTLPLVPLVCRLRGIKRAAEIPDAELSDLAGHCEAWTHRWGVVVVVGVILDVWLAWAEPPPVTISGRWGPVIASGCVAIGVWLEIVFSKYESTFQGELVRRSNDRLADVEVSNGFLEVRAAETLERAARADGRAADASHEAALATEEVMRARAAVVVLEMDLADAQLELAQFRAPRTFTPEQSDALIAALAPFFGMKVDILACGEGEMSQFAGVLMPNFHAAQWEPAAFLNVGGGLSVQGVRVRVCSDADGPTQQASRAIIHGLMDAGIEAFEIHDFAYNDIPSGLLTGKNIWVPTERAPIRVMIGPKT